MQAKKKESLKPKSYEIPPIFRQLFHKLFPFWLANRNSFTGDQHNFQLVDPLDIKQVDNITGMAADKSFPL